MQGNWALSGGRIQKAREGHHGLVPHLRCVGLGVGPIGMWDTIATGKMHQECRWGFKIVFPLHLGPNNPYKRNEIVY